jgi:hypothetical protein
VDADVLAVLLGEVEREMRIRMLRQAAKATGRSARGTAPAEVGPGRAASALGTLRGPNSAAAVHRGKMRRIGPEGIPSFHAAVRRRRAR